MTAAPHRIVISRSAYVASRPQNAESCDGSQNEHALLVGDRDSKQRATFHSDRNNKCISSAAMPAGSNTSARMSSGRDAGRPRSADSGRRLLALAPAQDCPAGAQGSRAPQWSTWIRLKPMRCAAKRCPGPADRTSSRYHYHGAHAARRRYRSSTGQLWPRRLSEGWSKNSARNPHPYVGPARHRCSSRVPRRRP